MQGYCVSRSAVARFRGEDVYVEFLKQWNVGVYFKLRYRIQFGWLLLFEQGNCYLCPSLSSGWTFTSKREPILERWERLGSKKERELIQFICLRFQEIAGALDSTLTAASLVPIQSSSSDDRDPRDLILQQSVSLLQCLRSCWRDDILVLSCSDKFLRLTLQLLSR